MQEIIRKHRQTFLQLFWMTYCNCNIAQWQIIIMYITYGKVFGGTFFMFWLFPENGTISEWTVNRALIVHTTWIFIFALYQNCPLALKVVIIKIIPQKRRLLKKKFVKIMN